MLHTMEDKIDAESSSASIFTQKSGKEKRALQKSPFDFKGPNGLYLTVRISLNRMSAEELPTRISNSPGSTTFFISLLYMDKCSGVN